MPLCGSPLVVRASARNRRTKGSSSPHQRTGGTGGRATPWGHVHHAAGEDDQTGHDSRAHADAAVQRQHGGHADHVSGRAVTIEGNDERQYGGADRNLQRVTLDQFEDLAHGRVEQVYGLDLRHASSGEMALSSDMIHVPSGVTVTPPDQALGVGATIWALLDVTVWRIQTLESLPVRWM